MSKKLIKGTSLFLVVLMSASLFAGCAKEAPKTDKAQAQSSASTDTKKEAAPLKVSILLPLYDALPDMKNQWWTNLFAKTNSTWDVTWVPTSDFFTKFDLVLASGDLPDVISSVDTNRPTLVSAIKNGAFADLTPVLGDFSKYPNLKNNTTKLGWNYVKINNKITGIVKSRAVNEIGVKIRKDWLDKLGLPMPTTLDELKNTLLKVMNSDPDGNGKNDTIGYVAFGNPDSLLGMGYADPVFMRAFGCYNLEKDAEGGLIYPNLTDGFIDYVQYVKELYDAGVISKEFLVTKTSQSEEIFTAGRGVAYTRTINRDYSYEKAIQKVQPGAIVETIPIMTGKNGNTTAILSRGTLGAFYLNAKLPEEKVKRIVDFYEQTCTEEWNNLAFFGIDGIHNTMVDGQRKLTELGAKEVGTATQQPITLIANTWGKILNSDAPKAYNDAKLKRAAVIEEKGSMNRFDVLQSDSWPTTWGKNTNEFWANAGKAVVGQMTMDKYKTYIKGLRESSEFKKAFKEFTQSNKDIFGN